MHSLEVGYASETAESQSSERAACLAETHNALGALDSEITKPDVIPTLVSDYISRSYPVETQSDVLDRAVDLQRSNPAIFDLDPEQLIGFLPTLLGRSDVEALKTEGEFLDAQITKERDVIQLEEIASTDPKLRDLRGRALLDALAEDPFVLSRPDLHDRLDQIEAKLNALLSVALDPPEAAVLERIISQSTINVGASNSADLYRDVLARIDTSQDLSEETKSKAYQLFNIPTVETASDLQTILDNGYGLDAVGNKLPITSGQKLRVFPNTYLYEDPSGDRLFEICVPGNRQYKVRFDRQTSEADLYDSSLTVQMMGVMAQMNLAEAIWQRGWTLQKGGIIDLHYDDVIKAKRIYKLMCGGNAGFDGRLISKSRQSSLRHRFQAFPKKGDAALDDNDPSRAIADYRELAIVDERGVINWSQFERAARYLQDVSARGGQPDFDELKAHLLGVNGTQ